MNASVPENEIARLEALRDYGILDTLPEKNYDDIVQLAAQICGTPIAEINFIDSARLWAKAQLGLTPTELPREMSFCTHAILTPRELTVVLEPRRDPRFADNPFVLGEPHIRFYAGAPLVTSEGAALGTLCVADQVPHTLSLEQEHALEALARQVMAQLELRRTVERLEESERRFETFLDNSPAIAFVKDEAGRMVYVNKPFERRFGMTANDWRGKDDFELWPEAVARTLHGHDARVLAENKTVELVESMPGLDGELNYWRTYKFPLTYGGRIVVAGMAVDITAMRRYEMKLEAQQQELERMNVRLAVQSATDPLTGLKNRRAFQERLEAEVGRARRYGSPLSLLILDVDHFKSYNDAFGHPAGDEVLRKVATLLLGETRSADLVARYGGEEFVVLLPDTELEGALLLAERCRNAIETADWSRRGVTISVGVSTLTLDTLDDGGLLEATDRALYEAKRDGRNCVRGSHPSGLATPPTRT